MPSRRFAHKEQAILRTLTQGLHVGSRRTWTDLPARYSVVIARPTASVFTILTFRHGVWVGRRKLDTLTVLVDRRGHFFPIDIEPHGYESELRQKLEALRPWTPARVAEEQEGRRVLAGRWLARIARRHPLGAVHASPVRA
ncbi:hypothetical protein LZC95_19790 [Pendulispora brunnea]|uniref:Uncharacterized protein n=1 Tax=Pendulispora brunnea TaxID=2905690 RepID=A0ABZ2KRU7_9BACT